MLCITGNIVQLFLCYIEFSVYVRRRLHSPQLKQIFLYYLYLLYYYHWALLSCSCSHMRVIDCIFVLERGYGNRQIWHSFNKLEIYFHVDLTINMVCVCVVWCKNGIYMIKLLVTISNQYFINVWQPVDVWSDHKSSRNFRIWEHCIFQRQLCFFSTEKQIKFGMLIKIFEI